MLRLMSFYRFSNVSMARGTLYKIISKEYKQEYHQYEQEPTLMKQIKHLGFQLIDDPSTNKVILNKEFSSAKISILFRGTPAPLEAKIKVPNEDQSIQQNPKYQDKIQSQLQETKQEYVLGILSVDYTVIIQTEKGEAIAFECNTSNQTTFINYVQPVYDIQEYKTRSKYRKFLSDYSGPEINKLDERLKQSLYTYLESYGINESLNALIEALLTKSKDNIWSF
ncbi:unnamed protein product (macronuclear) [Paramecium tetraurelia]|uniref:Uncharacterized protein n=1 Tax=Paramecium tetraurelia TaxID=5888 RepID=A0CSH0_PARTE|nr:uncharacterized protein GSPATT00010009001 [Paramecium tetraurelia]CAK73737.1 unnamed protein product [Paramecium tetraurelia]|eukprot:XP_001441134.1 hypothetical protein (macronuclear) [Paramecium tetraurelia strain d4-2]